MLRIRLRRVGKKKQPSYRIVVADSRSPRDGAFVERIGHYDPLIDPPAVTLDKERARMWLSRGAQPSDAVQRIFQWQRLDEDDVDEVAADVGGEVAADDTPAAVTEEETG